MDGRRSRREIIEHPGAAAVVAPDGEGRILMVRQHRYPAGDVLEIPAGTLERGEDPRACAFRELEEETGYRARRMTRLVSFYPSIGYNTEVIHCFLASGVERASGQRLDPDERITVRRMRPGRILSMIRTGRIMDSKTICAMQAYAPR